MLRASNIPIENVIRLFNGAGVTYGLLVPTATGYRKSIMDATLGFRSFLSETGIHRYAEQRQGQAHKAVVPARFVLPDRMVETTASLYRPCTKQGDPRLWFANLTRYCKPTDLLAVIALSQVLYVFNMSDPRVALAFAMPDSYPYEILRKCADVISEEAADLLGKLRAIHADGFVRGVAPGDTNVGMTLERLLGIAPNASRLPDYRGIEIKASRLHSGKSSRGRTKRGSDRVTLFTNVPDWSRSALTAADVLRTFGHVGADGRRQLYCTVSNQVNPQGLYLDAGNEIDLINKAASDRYTGDVMVWALERLRLRLREKHNETFWVQASVDVRDGVEYFRYDAVRHTRRPNVSNLATFFDTGIITVDLAMREKASGKVRDHGYLFRTTQEKIPLIFPLEKEYRLATAPK